MAVLTSRQERKSRKREQQRRTAQTSKEWKQETSELRRLQEELECLYRMLEDVVEEKLVESIIYQIKSAESRYDYHYMTVRRMEKMLDRRSS